MRTISEKLNKAVELIESHFQNWTTPSFFVQFGTGFAKDAARVFEDFKSNGITVSGCEGDGEAINLVKRNIAQRRGFVCFLNNLTSRTGNTGG